MHRYSNDYYGGAKGRKASRKTNLSKQSRPLQTAVISSTFAEIISDNQGEEDNQSKVNEIMNKIIVKHTEGTIQIMIDQELLDVQDSKTAKAEIKNIVGSIVKLYSGLSSVVDQDRVAPKQLSEIMDGIYRGIEKLRDDNVTLRETYDQLLIDTCHKELSVVMERIADFEQIKKKLAP